MSERNALLAAILTHPDEDTPRLAYADWLDEHAEGEPDRARAEFIRLQIEQARGISDARRRNAVEARCAELERAHRDAWLTDFRAACGPAQLTWSWERGFVAAVCGRNAVVVGRLPGVMATSPIQRVEIDHPWPPPGDPAFAALADCPRLAAVRRLECRRFGEDVARVLVASPHLTGLRTLYLQWGHLPEAVATVAAGAATTALRHLWVWGASTGGFGPGSGFNAILDADWPALTQLRLDNLAFGDAGALAAVRAFAARRRHAVHVSDQTMTEAGATAAAEAALADGLPAVSLGWGAPDLREPVEPLPDGVRAVAFRGFWRDGARLVGWAAATVPAGRLDRLGFRGCGLRTADARRLAAWLGLAGVKELDLRENQIGDAGATALAGSPHLEGVERLQVAHNDITQRGKDALKNRFGRRVRIT